MAVTPTTIGPSAEELEAGTGGDPVVLEGSGTEISVPDWISRAEAFQRSGDDLLIVGPDGQKAIISGFFSSGAMPHLITFTGEELPVEDVLARVEAGDPFEVAQAQTGGAATDAPLIQSETGAAPDTPTSLESLLVSLSNGAELDASLVDVFQQAVNEAVAQGASPDQATDAEPAFLQTLIEQVAQGATPEAALENAKAVFQAVAQATGEVDGPAQGGGLMQALASGENVDDVVGQLVQQQGGGLSADQVAAATNAFVEGLQQGLAEGAQPGDALAQAAVASQGAAEAEVVGELSGADALLAALASGDNADQVLTDLGVPADGDAGAAFADSLANALQSGQALDAALTDAADAQTLLAQAVADSQDPNIADPVLAALASGDNLEGVVGDSAAFQEALAQALQGGAAPGDALQQAGDTLATLDAAQAQTNDPAAADPLLAALASGDNVEGAVGDSEAFAENLANALEGGGSFTDAVQAANDQTASVDQALAQQTVPGGGDPVLAALASGGNVGQTLDELSSNDAGAASLVAALASGSSGTEAVQIVGDQSIAISDAISDTTTASAGEAAVVVDGALTVTEANAANFDGGQFTAQVTTNNTAADRLTITNQGTGAGQIGFDGTTVTFAGTAIGTVNGANNGTGTAPLTIDLNTNATPAAVQALARNVTYRNTDTSGTAVSDPVVSFTLAESNGTVSVTSTRTIDVNVRPVLTATAGSVAASAGETAVAVDTGLTVTDADSTDFSGGQFTAQVTTNNTAADRLTITNQGTGAGQIGFDGTTVTYGGTAIGTVNGANNGTGTAPLRLDLNANATPAAVQALSRAVTYQNTDTSGSAVSDPVVSFTLSDGDGATSAAATRTVDVNVRPVLTVTAGSVAVSAGGSAVTVDSGMTVSDADSADLSGGQFTAQVTTNNTANDRLTITNQGSGAGQIGFDGTTVTFGGTTIGTVNGSNNGTGTNALRIDLNASATPAAVQALSRAVTYQNVNSAANVGNDPVVTFSLTDGDGATAAAKTRTIDLVGAPELTATSGLTGFLPGDGAISVDPSITVNDPQNSFNGGYLRATISANGETTDRLTIENQGTGAGQIGFDGTNVTYGGTTIGTASGGSGTTALTITLNANANSAGVQKLAQAIQYNSVASTPGTGNRTITFDVSDGSESAPSVTRTVTIDQVLDTFSSTTPTQNVLNFDGGDHLSLGNSSAYIHGNAATWEAWINTSTTTGTQTIFGAGDLGSEQIFSSTFASTPSGISISGSATVTGGALRLTNSSSQVGTATINPSGSAEQTKYFTSTFDVKIGDNTTGTDGDGWSFNYGGTSFTGGNPEEGASAGLAITFDTFDNGSGDVFNQVQVLVDGAVRGTASAPGGTLLTETPRVLTLDGDNDYVDAGGGTGGELRLTGTMTAEAWVQPDTFDEPTKVVSIGGKSGDGDGAENFLFQITLTTGGDVELFHEYGTGTNQQVTFDTNLTAVQWVHLAAVRDATAKTYTLYVNGQQSGSPQSYTTNAAGGANASLLIGGEIESNDAIGNTLNGQVDDVRIWNTARTASEVAENYQKTLTGDFSGNLVSHFTFDGGNANDSAGSNNGTLTNGAATTTSHTAPARFEPVSITVDANGLDMSYKGTTLFTNLDLGSAYNPQSGHQFVMSSRTGGADDVVAIDNLTITSTDAGSVNALVVDGGELAFKTTDSTGTSTVSSDVSVADGNWHHVAMSHDGNNTLKLYVDGVHVKTQTGVTKEMIGGDAAIGQASDSNADHFTGQIGEVRVWDAVMTDAQIDNNFGPNLSNPSSTSNLVGYWNMKDVSGQTVTDLSSNSNTATLGASGSGGGDDPTTQSTTYPQLNSSHWTIVEGAGSYNGDTILVQDGNVEISNRELLRSSTEYDPTSSNPLYVTGRFTFEKAADIFSVITRSSGVADSSFFGYPTTAGSAQTMVGPALTAGQWYHAAVVIDSTADTGKLYLNGEAVATNTSLTLDPSQITTTVNYLGRSLHTADPDFDGQIGEFRIWNTARTDAQIADNYNNPLTGSESGLVTYYTFDELVSGAVVDEAGANNATVTGATIVDIAPTVYGTEVTIQENEAVTGTMATNDVAGTPTYSVQTAATKGTVIVDSTSGEWTYVPDVNYRGTDTFTLRATGATRGTDDETITVTVNAVNNDSINVHDGMVQFDGSNDLMRATVGTNTFSNQITMELWVNFLDLTAQQNPIRLGDAETTANRIVLEKRATTNNFSVFMGNNTTNTTVASDFVVSADTWYHTAFTYDGTTAKIYVNGNLVKSQAVSGVSLANTVQEVTVGGDTFGFFSKALVDDVRVWNTVRTAEQIRDNYDQQLTGSETNLQGYWRFDDDTAGTTLDDKTSNNRDGHLIEARYVMDMADPGGDGVATGMGVASVNNFPTEQITVEMWVIPDALNAALFSYAVSGSDNHLIFEVTSGGDLSVRRDATTVTITGVNIVVGAWTHLSVVWDAAADTVTVYQDGATAGSTTLVGGTMTTGGTIWLGNDQDSIGGGFQQNAAFDGRMSEVRLWDTARSATDIAADYNKQLVGTEEDLVGYWRLDESSGTTATDTTGNNNGTYQSNNTAQILRSPPIVAPDGPKLINNLGKALQFDGSDDVLEIIDTDTFDTANYTIETWVKLDSIANMTILGRTNSNGLGSQFSHLLHTDATGKFYHYTYDNVAASGKTALGSVTAVAGQWYHLAGTYDADTDTMKLYVDGQLQATTTGVGTPWPSGDRYQIGPNAAANNDFDGQMAEFRVWSSARTDAEIADSYNQALNPAAHSDLIGYYTFEGATGSAVTDLAGSVNGTVSGAKVVDTAPSVFGTALTVEENESVSGIMTGNDIVAPVLDLGRPGADGIATGMKFENFTDFPTTAISVELWVNPDQVPGDIVSYAVTGSDNEFLIGVNSSKTVVVYLNATAYTLTGLTVEPGQWDHLTVTWNGTDTLTGYKNGTQAATATTTVNDAMETGGTFYLGTDQDTVGGGFQNSNTYDGQVAEVRIWNDVRTSGEVSSNFNKELVGNEANLVAYWQLNEGSGTSAIDKTAGQSNAGTSNVTHTGTYESIGTAFVTAGEDVPALPLTNDGTVFSVTGAGTADADGRVTATTSNGGTVIVNQITGEYTYTPASNFYGTDTFTLTAAGDGDTSITDSETVSVTVNRVDHKSVNVHANVLKLDGSNDYVHASSVPTTKTDNITIETWFNWDGVTPTKNNVLVSLGTSTGNGVYVGGITSSGSLKLGANLPGAGTLLTDYTFTAGEWTHVALVRESGTWKFYVNGENQGISGGTASATSSITAPDANTWIGHTGFSSSEHFGGRIDEVRIWDDARTADEIRANYDQQMTGTEQNLQAYYRFEDNPGRTTVTDLTYNNHDGTLTNGAELSSTAGKSMTFDGSDDFIDLGTPGNLYTGTGAFTYEAWIKTTQSSNGYIVAVGDSSNNGASSLFFVTGGKVALHNPASQGPSSSTSVNDGQWHHVAATYSGGSVRLFVDGKLDATGTMATTLNLTSGAATIGKSVFGQFFNGEIADVRIWNDLRSDTEIREHYQKLLTGGEENLIAYYSFDDATASAVNDLAGSHNGTVTGAAVTESTAPIEGPTVRGTAIDTLDGDAVSGVMTADDLAGNPTYSVPSGPANGTVTIRANGEWTYTPTAGFVGTNTFTLRATDGTRTDDEVITVSVRSDDLGNVHDGVLQLDGSNDYVEMGRGASNELAITGNVTVEAWVNLADFQSQQNIIAQFAGPSENVADNILYGLRIDGSGDLVYFHEYAGAANEVLTFDANLTTATWAHVAVVRDVSGNTVTAYVNGNAVGNAQSYTNDPTSGGSSTLTIGEDNSSSTGIYTKGAIDDLRIWNTARTAEQIKHNYDQQQLGSESGLVAYYKFDDDHTGTTAADSAGTASNGTLSADSKVLSLDGTGDYLEVGNPSSIDFAAAITVEAWIKTSNTSGSQTIVGKSANGSWASGGKQLSLLANGKLVFNEFGGSLITGTTAINDGQWHHVAMTISEGGSSDVLKLYVDGVLETISAGTGAGTQSATIDRVADNGAHLVKVGSADGAGQFFNGQINDVRFWSDVRTQSEIYDSKNTVLVGNESGLARYFDFDRDTTAADDKASTNTANNGTLNGNASIISVNDSPTASEGPRILNTLGKAGDFDGSGDTITTSGIDLNNKSFSWEFWVNRDASDGTDLVLGARGSSDTSNSFFHAGWTTETNFRYSFEGSGSSNEINYTDTGGSIGQWAHWAGSFDATSKLMKLYKNGQLIATKTISQNLSTDNPLIIGGSQTSGHEINAKIDEVRIWYDVRTDQEILDNYNQTIAGDADNLAANYHFDAASGALVDSATGVGGTNSGTLNNDAARIETGPNVFGKAVTIEENETASGRFEADSTSYSVTGSPSNGAVVIDSATGAWIYTPTANFHGTDSFTVNASGAGTETVTVTVNSETTNSVNVADGALQFTGGTFDRMTADIGTGTLTNTLTLEMKVRFNDVSGQQNLAALFGESTDHGLIPYMSSGTFKTLVSDMADSSPTLTLDSGVTVAADTWYHLAVTYDGTTANYYVDGDLKATGSISGLTLASQAQKLVLGGNPLADPRYNQGVEVKGLIDEVRVWSDVRTAAEIRANKDQQLAGSEGNLEAYYRFDDDATGTTIEDITSNNRHGTTANGRYC